MFITFKFHVLRTNTKFLKLRMSTDSNKNAALASITATYTDSEGEAESDVDMDQRDQEAANSIESPSSSSEEKYAVRERNQFGKLVSYSEEKVDGEDFSNSDDDSRSSDYDVRDDSSDSRYITSSRNPPLSPTSFHRTLRHLKKHEIHLPPEPIGRCSNSLQVIEKISELYEKKKAGKDMNASIQQKKNFRNPSIYEKLIQFCNIDERGTNYPPEMYDPHSWGPESFYEELAKRQKEEMDKREKEKKERTKVEFISGTKKTTESSSTDSGKRKSKWDVGIQQMSASTLKPATLITPSVLPVATGTKPTVISAFGTISKKPKQ